ncbi:MAG: replication initiation protein [Terrimicrobiaceae bacterium]
MFFYDSRANKQGQTVTLNVSWLSSSEYVEGSGVVSLCFDPKLKPFLLQLKNRFTNYRIKNIVQLKSQFSIRIYELLKQYKKIGQRLFLVSDLRSILGIEDGQYKLYADFKRKVILIAQKELAKKTDISFRFEEIKIGHGVGQIRFYVNKKP